MYCTGYHRDFAPYSSLRATSRFTAPFPPFGLLSSLKTVIGLDFAKSGASL